MALLSAGVRFIPWRYAYAGGNLIFGQPDAYYHLRRAWIILNNFPRIPGIDTYMAYPFGAESPWPPLYDLVLAGLTWIFDLGAPTHRTLHIVTTALPPVLAGLTVVPVFLFARLAGGTAAGLAASVVAVFVPGHMGYSVVGSGDHHTAEPLLLVSFLYLFLMAAKSGGEEGGRRRALLSGAALGAAVLVWQGSVLFAVILAAGIGLWWAARGLRGPIPGDGEEDERPLAAGVTALATATLLVAAGRALYPSDTDQTRFDFGFFSWFQPLFLLLLTLFPALLLALSRRRAIRDRRRFLRALAVAGGGSAAAISALLLVPPVRRNIVEGVRFLLTRNVYLASINEFQPSFILSEFAPPITPGLLIDLSYLLIFLVPPVFSVVLTARRWRRGEPLLDAILFAVWTLVIAFLAFRQRRWNNAYVANIAIGFGWLAAAATVMSRRTQEMWSDFLAWREERRGERAERQPGIFMRLAAAPRLAAGFSLAVMGLLLYPYYRSVYEFAYRPPNPITSDLYNSLIWLRENTPRTKAPFRPVETPEYAVLASWDVGHWIQYIAERPTVVNNYGYQLRGNGLEDMLRFFLAEEEDGAAAACSKRGVRYLYLTDAFHGLGGLSPLIGVDFESKYVGGAVPHGNAGIIIPNEAYFRLPYARMYLFDGTARGDLPGLTRFRLVFESETSIGAIHQPIETKEVKIFEFVRGARISGRADPGQRVVLSCRLMTNFDRVFDYETFARADAKGRFETVFPYVTAGRSYGITSLSRGLAYTETKAVFFDVEEQDVKEGRTVSVDVTKGLPGRRHPGV